MQHSLVPLYICFLDTYHICYIAYLCVRNLLNSINNKCINLLFLLISIVYIYYCIDIIGYIHVNFNFNLSNNLSNLYYFSDSRLRLASALLLRIIIPGLSYMFLLIVSLICINYKVIILIFLGLYSLFILRNIFLCDGYTMKSCNIKYNIVDNIIIRAISIIIISLFILILLSIISLQYTISFSYLFIVASHGFFICINNVIKSLYYQYKEENTLQLFNYRYNNYFSKTSIILIIIIRFIYTYLIFHYLYLSCIIIVLFIICVYMLYKEELDKELTRKSKYILLICFILFCIIRIITIYIQYVHDRPFDIIKWFDNDNNNDNRGDNSNNENEERTNLNHTRLPDLPQINIPPRNNTPLISSITSMRSSWDQISSTRGVRNSVIVNQGLNYNHTVASQHMHFNRANVPTSFERDALHSLNRNRLSNFPQSIFPGNRNIINLPLPHVNTQPVLFNNNRPELVLNTTPVLGGNNVPQSPVDPRLQLPTNNIPQVATSSRASSYLWLTAQTSGPIEHAEVPYPQDIEFARRYNLPVPRTKGLYIVRFSNSFIDSDSLRLESNTPPTPSSPIERDWMDIAEVPESRIDELVPEIERVPSPVRRFSKYEIWDKLHDHPLKDSYPLSDETYLPHDRLPTSTRLEVYNGFVIYDRINEDFSFSGLDRDKWFGYFIMRNGVQVID